MIAAWRARCDRLLEMHDGRIHEPSRLMRPSLRQRSAGRCQRRMARLVLAGLCQCRRRDDRAAAALSRAESIAGRVDLWPLDHGAHESGTLSDGRAFRWSDFSSVSMARSAERWRNGAGRCCGCGPRRSAWARTPGSPATPAASSFSIGPATRASSFRWRCLHYGCCLPLHLSANGRAQTNATSPRERKDSWPCAFAGCSFRDVSPRPVRIIIPPSIPTPADQPAQASLNRR